MNLLEHYIKEVHSVTDVTKFYSDKARCPLKEPLYEVDLTYDCYGRITRKIRCFFKSEWEEAKSKGYFMA